MPEPEVADGRRAPVGRRWSGSRRGRSWAMALVTALSLAVVVIGLGSAPRAAPDRIESLESRLRCPVCKSVSIAESPAPTAATMRRIVREQVAASRTDAQIIEWFQSRYGEGVLLDPPRRGSTLWLWVLPALAALGASVVLARRAQPPRPAPPLSEGDRQRVRDAVSRQAAERSGHERRLEELL